MKGTCFARDKIGAIGRRYFSVYSVGIRANLLLLHDYARMKAEGEREEDEIKRRVYRCTTRTCTCTCHAYTCMYMYNTAAKVSRQWPSLPGTSKHNTMQGIHVLGMQSEDWAIYYKECAEEIALDWERRNQQEIICRARKGIERKEIWS